MSRLSHIRYWKSRERRYTRKYATKLYRVLLKQWSKAINQYLKTGFFEVDESLMLSVYKKIYSEVTEKEASILLKSITELTQKDLLSTIVRLFTSPGDIPTIRFIMDLMNQYFDVYILERLRDVTANTKKLIAEAIQKGIDKGLTSKDIAKLIMDEAGISNKQRAVRIARTEVITSANRAQMLTHEASPYEYEKSWLQVVDDKTREGHLFMNNKVFIDLWDHFEVKNNKGVFEKMLHPGDPQASASNVVHCRCLMLYRVKKDSNGRPIRKI